MSIDVEETLSRELREVANGLRIPAMPPLPQKLPPTHRHWQPLLVAAALVLIVAGVVAAVATTRGGQELEPAPPSPSPTESVSPSPSPSPTESASASPSQTEPVISLPRTAPTVPYVLAQRLYVDGQQVPGNWWSVRGSDTAWLALRTDNTWWWGRGPEPNEITGPLDVPPVMSPNGEYVAEARTENGKGVLTGFETTAGGTSLGSVSVDLGDPQDGSAVTIRAVTNDGKVIAQGTNTSLLWLPLAGNRTVDLTVTAPRQQILGSTPAGLVVTDGAGGVIDGAEGQPYLAEISDAGELSRIAAIPAHDDLVISPGAAWLAWTAPNTTRGDVIWIPALEVASIDGWSGSTPSSPSSPYPTQRATLSAPDGWGFRIREWVWEDDDYLVSPVVGDADGAERMARCNPQTARCVLINAP